MPSHEVLLTSYRNFFNSQGRLPHHVAELAINSGIAEKEFYESFSSLMALEKHLFKAWAEQSLDAVHQDSSYDQYSVRDKMLSLCFTLLDTLKPERSLVKAIVGRSATLPGNNAIKGMFNPFGDFFQVLIVEGTTSGEVIARPFIGPKYKDVLWWSVLLVLQYWLRDDSELFEQTDVAVEKTVHFAFDLMAPNALDSATGWISFYIKSLF
jgi:hypothetical protein